MNSVETTQVPVVMVRKRSGALMSPHGPGVVALTLGFTSLRSHPVPSLRWGCENTTKYLFLASFSAPWCHLSDGCHLTHDYGNTGEVTNHHFATLLYLQPVHDDDSHKPEVPAKSVQIITTNNASSNCSYSRPHQ